MQIRSLWQSLVDRAFWYGTEGIAAFAISAIDMALWDLKGQILDQSVASLLGGWVCNRVPAMASIVFNMDDVAWTVDQFKLFQQQGFRFVKAGWGMSPSSLFGMHRDRDAKMVASIREAIGFSQELVVDVPGHNRLWISQRPLPDSRIWNPIACAGSNNRCLPTIWKRTLGCAVPWLPPLARVKMSGMWKATVA